VRVTGEALGFGSRTYMHLHVVNSGRFAATVTEVGYRVMSRERRWAKWSTQYCEGTAAEDGLPLRLEGQADFEIEVPLTRSPPLLQLLDDHPDWHLFPWARVGGRSVQGRRVVDDQIDIRQRLRGYPPSGDPSIYLPMD
jgi:hypothetical protein